ncbi:hypothetical protein ACFY4C_21030 [Actinomadura viridis]|uniref:hypothetical protein n=1 Tax=Actinomadura viridis TaxID=58110 RepID=UPI0036BFB832
MVAKRWDCGWELHIEDVGVTQVKRLNNAEETARDYIALDRDLDPDSFDVEITPDVGEELGRGIAEAKRATADAERAQERAAKKNRRVADLLRQAGLSGREIALVLMVSPQRVSQLLSPGDKPGLLRRYGGRDAGREEVPGDKRRLA